MTKTVLIVEDNALNMKMFIHLLEGQGFETIPSPDGDDLINLVDQRRPHLILMDIQLPGRSGLEWTRLIKAEDHLKHIPIVAVTAGVMTATEEVAREAGCDDYLSKPISMALFLSTVAKYLG